MSDPVVGREPGELPPLARSVTTRVAASSRNCWGHLRLPARKVRRSQQCVHQGNGADDGVICQVSTPHRESTNRRQRGPTKRRADTVGCRRRALSSTRLPTYCRISSGVCARWRRALSSTRLPTYCRIFRCLASVVAVPICVPPNGRSYPDVVQDLGDERRGTVFLVIDDPETAGTPGGRVDGYWEADDALVAQLPGGMSLDAAIAWARQRSSKVLVRNDDASLSMPTGRYFWAGDAPRPDGVEPAP